MIRLGSDAETHKNHSLMSGMEGDPIGSVSDVVGALTDIAALVVLFGVTRVVLKVIPEWRELYRAARDRERQTWDDMNDLRHELEDDDD